MNLTEGLPTESVLGPYELTGELGRGGMGSVYRAVHRLLRQPRALKVLRSDLADDNNVVARFRREAELAAGLRHPNIVIVHDIGQDGNQYYLVMDLVARRSLDKLLTIERPLPVDQAVHILQQVANGLDYAHSRGVIHRDVKPANIIVGPDEHATIVDFGIAHAVEGTRFTRPGFFSGTPEYMAPEIWRGQSAEAATDGYALAVVAYELLTGRVPFEGPSNALMHEHLHLQPPSLRTIRPELPESVERVIRRQLAKDPAVRYGSVSQFVSELAQAIHPIRPIPPNPPKPPFRKLGSPALNMTLRLVVGMTLVVVVVWQSMTGNQSSPLEAANSMQISTQSGTGAIPSVADTPTAISQSRQPTTLASKPTLSPSAASRSPQAVASQLTPGTSGRVSTATAPSRAMAGNTPTPLPTPSISRLVLTKKDSTNISLEEIYILPAAFDRSYNGYPGIPLESGESILFNYIKQVDLTDQGNTTGQVHIILIDGTNITGVIRPLMATATPSVQGKSAFGDFRISLNQVMRITNQIDGRAPPISLELPQSARSTIFQRDGETRRASGIRIKWCSYSSYSDVTTREGFLIDLTKIREIEFMNNDERDNPISVKVSAKDGQTSIFEMVALSSDGSLAQTCSDNLSNWWITGTTAIGEINLLVNSINKIVFDDK